MLNLILEGLWSPAQVIANTVDSSRPIIPEIESVIMETWAEHNARLGSALFDGPMSRLESFQTHGPELHLSLSTTSYRIFLGTNLCHADLAKCFGRPALANAIGLSAALLTADGKLVMGRRNHRVAYYPNCIHPFAGALEPSDVPNIFDGIRRELAEELHLRPNEVTDLHMLAIIEDRKLLQPEFIFSAQTDRLIAELLHSLDAAEHQELWTCEASAEALGNLLDGIDPAGRSGGDLFTPVAVGTVSIFGQRTFGRGWVERYAGRFFGHERETPAAEAAGPMGF